MEQTYDCNAAKTALIALLNNHERDENVSGEEWLSLFKQSEEYKVHEMNSPPIIALVKDKPEKNSTTLEEAIFIAHGIILEKDLPPIKLERQSLQNQKRKNRLAGFIRQYVAVTGLNLEDFNKTLEGVGKIHRYFEDALPNSSLGPMEPLLIDDNLAMAAYTRYFLPAIDCRSSTLCTFGPGVDPDGDLVKLGGTSYVHTEHNVVQYLGRRTHEGKSKFYNIDPSRFQKGDIVEVSISFFCVKTRSGTLKMVTSLKSLILLDDSFREKAREDLLKESLSKSLKMTKLHVKRRFVETESDEVLIEKCARMDI